MPRPVVFEGQRLPASYANFYIANGVVLVPTFNDPADRIALNTLAELFPDRQVIGIHSVDLVLGLGTLHCLSQQQPAGPTSQSIVFLSAPRSSENPRGMNPRELERDDRPFRHCIADPPDGAHPSCLPPDVHPLGSRAILTPPLPAVTSERFLHPNTSRVNRQFASVKQQFDHVELRPAPGAAATGP